MDKQTMSFFDALNRDLNRVYTANYQCLKATARENQDSTIELPTFSGSTWLRDKVEIVAKKRNNYINTISKTVATKMSPDFVEALENYKLSFMENFEAVYGPSGTFDDCFDGYEITHKGFKEDFFKLDIQNHLAKNTSEFKCLCYNYIRYLEYYKQLKIYEGYVEIFNSLCDDLNSDGYKTFMFQKPQKGVTLLSADKIQEMHALALSHKKRVDISYKSALKKKNKSFDRLSTTKEKTKQSAKENYSYFLACFEHEENQNEFVSELCHFTESLMTRLKWANSTPQMKKTADIYAGFYDLMAGVNIFSSKNNYETDQIYVHENELEYYQYLLEKVELLKTMRVVKLNNPQNGPQNN